MYPYILDADVLKNLDTKTLKVIEQSKDENDAINRLLKIIISFNRLKSKEEILNIYPFFSKRTFDDLVRANQIPHYKINNKTKLFDPLEISNYMNTHYKVGV